MLSVAAPAASAAPPPAAAERPQPDPPAIVADPASPSATPAHVGRGDRRDADGGPEVVVTAQPRLEASDPLRGVNVKSFELTQAVDLALIRPVALGYQRIPEPIRDGVRNFLRNLTEPVIFLNFVLQIHIGKAAETVGRFVVNSTAGGAGLFDVAKHKGINLPRRVNGFADTLGYYGVKPGAFLFVPIIGPTTVRDMIGNFADRLVLPLAIGFPFDNAAFTIPSGLIASIDRRAEFEETLQDLRAEPDPYETRRNLYLRDRQREIDGLRGVRKTAKAAAVVEIAERSEPAETPLVLAANDGFCIRPELVVFD